MDITRNRIVIPGLDEEVRILHTSDNHLCHADSRDNERKQTLANERHMSFEKKLVGYEKELDSAISYSAAHCDILCHTGDIIDFVSYQNLEIAKEKLSRCDYFMAAGNHEYSLYVGESKEDAAYRAISYDLVQSAFSNDLTFASRIVKGINLVSLDDGYYHVTDEQTEALAREVEKGYPIVLMMHAPIYTPGLYSYMMDERGAYCAYTIGTPEKLLTRYSEYRRLQQLSNDETERFISFVGENCGEGRPIKCILTGHLHVDYSGEFCGITQFVTGGGIYASARELILSPGATGKK